MFGDRNFADNLMDILPYYVEEKMLLGFSVYCLLIDLDGFCVNIICDLMIGLPCIANIQTRRSNFSGMG